MAKKKLQKALALLMAFSMTMSLLSVTAFAEGGEDSSEEAAEVVHEHNRVKCKTCDGTHEIEVVKTCTECNGEPETIMETPCPKCDGEKKLL